METDQANDNTNKPSAVDEKTSKLEVETQKDEPAENVGPPCSESKKRPAPEQHQHQHQQQPAKKIKKKHMDPKILAVRQSIQMCCKDNDLATALEVYRDALKNNIRVEPQIFYSLLNLCDGLDRKVHVGTPKPNTKSTTKTEGSQPGGTEENSVKEEIAQETTTIAIRPVDLETRKQAAYEIKEQMTRQKIPLNETAYSALVKILSRAKELPKADEILKEAEGVSQCRVKLRLYSGLLLAYCEMGQLLPALQLWVRLAKRELALTEKEYSAIMDCNVVHGLGSVPVMQKIFTELSEDVLVPAKETSQAIVRWFESSCSCADTTAQDDPTKKEELDAISFVLSQIPLPPNQTMEPEPIGPVQSDSGWTISPVCNIDTETGTLLDGCMEGETLQPVHLSDKAWQEMLDLNSRIVVSGKLEQDASPFQGGSKGPKRPMGEKEMEVRRRKWKDFLGYLDHQTELRKRDNFTTTYDVVLDGANIGYFDNNYAGAPKHVNYDQIDIVVRYFANLKKRIFLVMHQRHFAPTLMPKRFRPLIQSWERAGILFKSPAGMNDDWFWMQAALVSGPGTLVVTNDQMRDHFFQMLSPRSFLRWKERHQVFFHFGGDDKDIGAWKNGRRPLVPTFPDIYSRRIQRLAGGYVIPHPKQGDDRRFLDGAYFADETAAKEETYLCIRPKQSVVDEPSET